MQAPRLESSEPWCSPGLPERPVWHLSLPPHGQIHLCWTLSHLLSCYKMKLLNVPPIYTWVAPPHLHLREYMFIWAMVSCRVYKNPEETMIFSQKSLRTHTQLCIFNNIRIMHWALHSFPYPFLISEVGIREYTHFFTKNLSLREDAYLFKATQLSNPLIIPNPQLKPLYHTAPQCPRVGTLAHHKGSKSSYCPHILTNKGSVEFLLTAWIVTWVVSLRMILRAHICPSRSEAVSSHAYLCGW